MFSRLRVAAGATFLQKSALVRAFAMWQLLVRTGLVILRKFCSWCVANRDYRRALHMQVAAREGWDVFSELFQAVTLYFILSGFCLIGFTCMVSILRIFRSAMSIHAPSLTIRGSFGGNCERCKRASRISSTYANVYGNSWRCL